MTYLTHQAAFMNKGRILLAGIVLLLISFQLVSCGGENNDAAIQTKISELTNNTSELQNVSASVSKGVVTLLGQCKSEKDREKAEKVIKNIDEVEDVINNITVTELIEITPDSQLKDLTEKAVKEYKHIRADVKVMELLHFVVALNKTILEKRMMDLNSLRPRRIDNQLVVE